MKSKTVILKKSRHQLESEIENILAEDNLLNELRVTMIHCKRVRKRQGSIFSVWPSHGRERGEGGKNIAKQYLGDKIGKFAQ